MFIELPWDQPSTGCSEYIKWTSNDQWTTITPWRKIDTFALSLLRKILDPQSTKRMLLDKIIDHKWCHLQFNNTGKRWHLSIYLFVVSLFFLFIFS